MNGDHVVTAIGMNGQILAHVARTRDLVEEMRARHDTWPVVTAALGRVATVGAIMTASLKHPNHQVTLQVHGDGPVGKILAVATGRGEVRGYAHEPHVELPLRADGKLDVGGAVGHDGSLYVIKDVGLREPYRGNVPLVSGEIGEDFTYYFSASEQTPSAVSVGVLVDTDLSVRAAGGLLLQVLPGADERNLDQIEEALRSLPSMTTMFNQGETVLDVLARVFGSDYKVLGERPLSFRCTCNRNRLANVLRSLGRAELQSMLEEQGQAELVCHFCGDRYVFDASELRQLQDEATTDQPDVER